METREVPADILIPGDEVRIDFEIVGDNEAQILTAVHEIKQTIAADARFNYQSGRIVDRWLGEELPAKYLEIYVTVRKTPKQEADQVDIQRAGFGIGVLVGLALAAVAAFSAVVVYRDVKINKTAQEIIQQNNDIMASENLSDEEKAAMIEANREAAAALAKSAGGWLAGAWDKVEDTAAAAADRTEKLATTVSIVAGLVVIAMYFAGRD